MTSLPSSLALATLAVSAAAAAQTQVVAPATAAATEAPQLSLNPFSTGSGFRWQQIWFDTRLGAQQTTIAEIAYRAEDGPGAGGYPFPAVTFQNVVVKVGATTVGPFHMLNNFDANATLPLTTGFQGNLSLPAHTPTGTGPAPFAIAFRFNQPVTMVMAGLPVLLEITASGGPAAGYPVDADDALFLSGGSLNYGTGSMTLNGSAGVVPGLAVSYQACANQALTGVAILGVQRMALDLSIFGANGEWLNATPDLSVPATLMHMQGAPCPWTLSLTVPVPQNPGLAGAKVRAQVLALDPTANPLGLRSTNGVESTVGRVPAYASGTLFQPNPAALQGALGNGVAPVARITGTFL